MSLIAALLFATGLAVCEPVAVSVPPYACKGGQATVAVPVIPDATYSWSIEGAAIVSGAGTPRVTLGVSRAGAVKATCVITNAECSRIAGAEFPVRDTISINQLTVPATMKIGEPVTITWSYGAAAPTSQLLDGDALEAPVPLPANVRSYTFTPKISGARGIELRASYYTAMSGGPQPKRRAARGSVATASDCGSVSLRKPVIVEGCSTFGARITVPPSIDASSTFQAFVDLEEGERAEWSVENGTILEQSPITGLAVIRAAESGVLEVTATVERGACQRVSNAIVPIVAAALQCPVPPVATMSLLSRECGTATVQAAFTGTAPFRGVWSDGTPFETWSNAVTQTFDEAGTYALTSFRDATCIGVVQGAAQAESLRPTVKLETAGGPCTNGTLRATLTGIPPFQLLWSDGTSTTTNDLVVDKTPSAPGTWSVTVGDAVCGRVVQSSPIYIDYPPRARTYTGVHCRVQYNEPVEVTINVSGPPPYTAEWSDGVVTTSTTPNQLVRTFAATSSLQEVSILRVTGNGCEAAVETPLVRIGYRPRPALDPTKTDLFVCPGETGTAALAVYPENATIAWSVTGGEIVSGQGTPSVTFRGTGAGDGVLRVETSFPDGTCTGDVQSAVRFHGYPEIRDLKAPDSIRVGGTAVLTWTQDNAARASITTQEVGRRDELLWYGCTAGRCRAEFVDKLGAGSITFEIRTIGECGNDQTVLRTMSITE